MYLKPNENIICTMDDVRGDFLWPPYGTPPAAVITNQDKKIRSWVKEGTVTVRVSQYKIIMLSVKIQSNY